MTNINDLFGDFPRKTVDFYKKNSSISGKTKTDNLVLSSIEVFIQTRKSNLVTGITAGKHFKMYVDTSILAGNEIDFGDKFKIGTDQYEVKGLELKDYESNTTPFYQLEVEKRI
jgi:hypothetical protein